MPSPFHLVAHAAWPKESDAPICAFILKGPDKHSIARVAAKCGTSCRLTDVLWDVIINGLGVAIDNGIEDLTLYLLDVTVAKQIRGDLAARSNETIRLCARTQELAHRFSTFTVIVDASMQSDIDALIESRAGSANDIYNAPAPFDPWADRDKGKVAKAYAFAAVTVTDPLTGLPVDVTMYLHPNGGVFGIDASFFENGGDFQLANPNDDDSDPIVFDPFENCTGRRNDIKIRLSDEAPKRFRSHYNASAESRAKQERARKGKPIFKQTKVSTK